MSDYIDFGTALTDFLHPLIEKCGELKFTDHPASYLYLLYGPMLNADSAQAVWDEIKHRDRFESLAMMQEAQFLANRAYSCMRDEERWHDGERLLLRMQTVLTVYTGRRDVVGFGLLRLAQQQSDGNMSWLLTFVSMFTQLGIEICTTPGVSAVELKNLSPTEYEFLQDVTELYADIHVFAKRLNSTELVHI